jgi:hypothetical protein
MSDSGRRPTLLVGLLAVPDPYRAEISPGKPLPALACSRPPGGLLFCAEALEWPVTGISGPA